MKNNSICSLEAKGLNPIFGHREDEVVPLDPTVARELDKAFQKPDAIFGLRESMCFSHPVQDLKIVPSRVSLRYFFLHFLGWHSHLLST
jgi:hypothetical protein